MNARRIRLVTRLTWLAAIGLAFPAASAPYAWRTTFPQGNGLWGVDTDGTIAVAVGEVGTTVRSTDGGLTWTDLSDFEALDVTLSDVAIVDVSTFVAVGEGAFIYRSVDGGSTWSPVPSPAQLGLLDVQTLPSGALSAIGYDGQVLRSTDMGLTWTAATPTGIWTASSQLWFDDLEGFVVGQLTAKRTHDGGQSWVDVPDVTDAPPIFSEYTDVDFFDAMHGVITAPFQTWRTTDGGASWTEIPLIFPCPSYQQRVVMRGPSRWFVAVGTEGGELWETLDAGVTYTLHVEQRSVAGFFDMAEAPDGRLVTVSLSGDLWHSTVDGQSWANAATTIGGNERVAIQKLVVRPSGRGYAAGTGLTTTRILRSENHGATWTPTEAQPTLGWTASMAAVSDDVVLVGGAPGTHVHRTFDGGASWTAHPVGVTSFYVGALAAADADHLFATTAVSDHATRLIRSLDGGVTWAYGDPNLASSDGIPAITFIDPQIGYAAGGSFFGALIWKTADGGENWTLLPGTGLPTGHISDMCWLDATTGCVAVPSGAGAGIFRSTDGGETWAGVATGGFSALELTGSRGVAAGYTRNFYRSSTDGGVTWDVLDVPWSAGAFDVALGASGSLVAGGSSVILELDPGVTVSVPGGDGGASSASGGLAVLALRAVRSAGARVALDVTLAVATDAHVSVFDVRGRRVQTLHLGALPEGSTRLEWDGRTDGGGVAATGVYMVVARVRGERAAVRVVLVR